MATLSNPVKSGYRQLSIVNKHIFSMVRSCVFEGNFADDGVDVKIHWGVDRGNVGIDANVAKESGVTVKV